MLLDLEGPFQLRFRCRFRHPRTRRDDTAVGIGLLARLEAEQGEAAEIGAFPESGRAIAPAEEGVGTRHSFRLDEDTSGIFDTFDTFVTEDARQAHIGDEFPRVVAQSVRTCSPGEPQRGWG